MTALFSNPSAALAELRQDRLQGPLFDGYTFSDSHLERMLAASEADAERALRTYFGSVEVLPDDGDQATRDALDEAGTRWIEDPGYDWEPGFFQGDRWGYLRLRWRPVVRVVGMRFVYPQPASGVFNVPADWIRLDKKAGDINLVPGTVAFTEMMAGGRTIPRMIQVHYVTGIARPDRDYPELADLVLQMAALRVLKGLFPSGSSSLSIDGMSQSESVAIADYQTDIDTRTERLRQAIHGIQVCAL